MHLIRGPPTSSFCASCALEISVRTCLFHYHLPPPWWWCDIVSCNMNFPSLSVAPYLKKKKSVRKVFICSTELFPAKRSWCLWGGCGGRTRCAVLWLRIHTPLTLEAWTFGDGEVSFALVQCYDSGWGPYFFLICYFHFALFPLSCLLLAYFVLGRLWDSASGLIWTSYFFFSS